MKKVLGCIRRADEEFGMIAAGERVMVGVSGGKDSLLLLKALKLYQYFCKNKFTLVAATVSIGIEPFDLTNVAALCEELEIPYIVKQTDIGRIVFEDRKEKNPCALCAKMRRAVLCKLAKEEGCAKLALGHHREDVLETLLLSLLYEGRLRTFSPVSYLSRSEVTVIRPFVFLPEADVKRLVKKFALPVVKSPCPVDGGTKRQEMKDLLTKMTALYPDASEKLLGALRATDQYRLWDGGTEREE